MRYFRIFLLNLQVLVTERGRSFVWFLIALVPSFILYLYWRGAILSNGGSVSGWTLSTISTYYIMLAVASSFLMAHIEEDIAREDIQKGELVSYLVKPSSYYLLKFFKEIPYRILQGFYGVIVLFFFLVIFHNLFKIAADLPTILLSLVIIFLAFMLSFTFKMALGLCAFWFTDTGGFYQLVDAILIICAGFMLPLSLLPNIIAQITYILPFSYMIYFPIVALEGSLSIQQLMQVIFMQLTWITIMAFLYSYLWKMGTRKFSGIGQ